MKKKLLFLLIPFFSYSQVQVLDPSFHGDGLEIHAGSDSPSAQYAYDALLQPDGKIIYAGRINSPQIGAFVARYNPDGSKDSSFNQYGFKTFSSPSLFQTVVLQNDGKILLAGLNSLFRLSPNGSLDPSFNTTGILSITMGVNSLNIKCISVQSDGKIIASGYINSGTTTFAVARINSNGSLDTTFDGDGIATIAMSTGNDEIYSHKIQADGKIVVFGAAHNGTDYDFAMARITTTGSLDTSFGTGGKTITSFVVGNDYGRSGEILQDGKILLLGVSGGKFALARYLDNGILDTSFSGDGKLTLNENLTVTTTTTNGSSHFIPRLKILSSGKILMAGNSNNDFKTIQLLADGSYDTSFDFDGVVTVNNNTDTSSILLQKPDGKIITGGNSYVSNLSDAKIKQIELDTNGSVLSNTDKNIYTSYDESIGGTLKLSDQSIVVVSSVYINYQKTLVVEKFLPDGFHDMDFGTLGHTYIAASDNVNKILLLSDDSIIVNSGLSLYKITPSGILDAAFGTAGILNVLELTNYQANYIDDMLISNDNKILLACDYIPDGNSTILTGILKFNLNGTFDTAFGTNGTITYGFSNLNNYNEWPNAFFQDANGKIIVASVTFPQSQSYSSKISFSRLNPDGSFDSTFGTNGKITHDYAPSIWTNTIRSGTDNGYLVSFHEPSTNGLNSSTLKINNDGSIYTLFGNNGVARDITGTYNNNMIVIPNGKYLKAGLHNNQFSISRYNTDGTSDSTFGTNGEINTTIGFASQIYDIELQADGKLLAIGSSFDGNSRLITLARYTNVTLGTLDFSEGKKALLIYPNPIENEANFEYTLANPEKITITILDFQGKAVKNIVSGQYQDAGKQKLLFSTEGLSSGNYIVRIASESGSQSVHILKK
ncbi:T9SS type A sorting domain-containing protein [Flavobacterium humi]|uniref:T9SS type A sorting domain-containing protein n=1 Tax=Flavobacterium humi TaxID=2562683 RepID=A0A4Z0L402_9FLAO|nr:T9SS type A sorting domain-containing protein [Flavobacterium humi]TGD56957.1 T9SS type A sorting domain-containing protein [Flavobacterium humi]